MGVVWKAEDTRLDREVAIKVLPEDFAENIERLARFEREAKAVAVLNHPHIVTLFNIENDGATHFLTMELVEGTSLDRRGYAVHRARQPLGEWLQRVLQRQAS